MLINKLIYNRVLLYNRVFMEGKRLNHELLLRVHNLHTRIPGNLSRIAIRDSRWLNSRPVTVKNATLYFHLPSWDFFLVFHQKNLFLLFSFLFLMKYRIFATEYFPIRMQNIWVRGSMCLLCLDFKMSKFTLQLNQFH